MLGWTLLSDKCRRIAIMSENYMDERERNWFNVVCKWVFCVQFPFLCVRWAFPLVCPFRCWLASLETFSLPNNPYRMEVPALFEFMGTYLIDLKHLLPLDFQPYTLSLPLPDLSILDHLLLRSISVVCGSLYLRMCGWLDVVGVGGQCEWSASPEACPAASYDDAPFHLLMRRGWSHFRGGEAGRFHYFWWVAGWLRFIFCWGGGGLCFW